MEEVERRQLEITLSVDARSVAWVRRLVGSWVGDALDHDEDAAWRAEIASSELLENIVRSAAAATARLCVSVISDRDDHRIIVSSNNRAKAECLAEVKREIAALHRVDDPLAHYQRRMRETLALVSDSALGLARIRAEAEMELESFVYQGEVTVVARKTLSQKR